MLGVAALALASCNKTEFESYTQEQIVEAKYNQAFVNTFGQPAANHTWGFGTTRAAVNVNGNMWEETPEVSPAEKKKVFNYVNMTRAQMKANNHKYTEVFPENLPNYWVTQVWTGTDTYSTFDGLNTGIVGSSKMNNLHIGENEDVTITNGDLSEGWYHVNNFNRGDNTDWSGNTLISESGTVDFAYHNSEDNNYHNKWIAVNGADIDPSLAGYYYVCFDFIGIPDGCSTNFRFKIPGNNPGEWSEKTATVPGAWTIETAIANNLQVSYTENVWNNETQQLEEVVRTYYVGQEGTTAWSIDNVVSGNMAIPCNDVYTDWIIRLVAAQPAEVYDGRIMGEDLSASEGTDFDFNDVVFDFKIIDNGAKAKIELLAAGGTLPLRIGGTKDDENSGVEVHGKFGVNINVMVNTAKDASPKIVIKPYQKFEITASEAGLEAFTADGSDIPVFVKKNGEWMELTARRGNPASKFRCATTTKWVDEYINIDWAYPKFNDWVENPSVDWESEVVEKFVNLIINQPDDNKGVVVE